MIRQQITMDQNNMSGKLVITADPGYLAELNTLYLELAQRSNIQTDGEITMLPPADPPIIEE